MISNEGWNEPSDLVWENIEKSIYDDGKKSYTYFHFLLLGLSFLSLIFIGFLYFQNIEKKQSTQKISPQIDVNKITPESKNIPDLSSVTKNDKTHLDALSEIKNINSSTKIEFDSQKNNLTTHASGNNKTKQIAIIQASINLENVESGAIKNEAAIESIRGLEKPVFKTLLKKRNIVFPDFN